MKKSKFPDPLKLPHIKKGNSVIFNNGIVYHNNLFAEVAADRDRAAIHAVMIAFEGSLQRILPAIDAATIAKGFTKYKFSGNKNLP
jgi:hypothetical protein